MHLQRRFRHGVALFRKMLCLKARCSFPSFALNIKTKENDLRGNENHCTTILSRAEQMQQVSSRDLCRCMVLWTHREIRFCVLQLMVTLLHMRTYRRGPSLDHWKSMKIVKNMENISHINTKNNYNYFYMRYHLCFSTDAPQLEGDEYKNKFWAAEICLYENVMAWPLFQRSLMLSRHHRWLHRLDFRAP